MLRIGFVSTYPPTHCGVAEYTRMLSMSIKSVAQETVIYVFCDRGSGGERYDHVARVHVYPVFEKKSRNYSLLLDHLSSMNGVDILHVQHEYGIFGDHNSILDAVLEARREGLGSPLYIIVYVVIGSSILPTPCSGFIGHRGWCP